MVVSHLVFSTPSLPQPQRRCFLQWCFTGAVTHSGFTGPHGHSLEQPVVMKANAATTKLTLTKFFILSSLKSIKHLHDLFHTIEQDLYIVTLQYNNNTQTLR